MHVGQAIAPDVPQLKKLGITFGRPLEGLCCPRPKRMDLWIDDEQYDGEASG